jgi:hypothetical protein
MAFAHCPIAPLEPIPKTPIEMEVCRYETRLRGLERSPRRRTSSPQPSILIGRFLGIGS